MAGGGKVKIEGGVASHNEAVVTNGRLHIVLPPGAVVGDNLGNHIATQDLNMATFNVDNAGRVGIGIAAPAYLLHVHVAASGGAANAAADDFVIENNSGAGLSIITSNVTNGAIFFGDNGNTQQGRILYRNSPDTMSFYAGSVEGVRLSSSGTRVQAGVTAAATSTLDLIGSLAHLVSSVAATPHTAGDEVVILVDASGGAHTENLPAAANADNRLYHIKKTDATANTVTVDASGAETIDGALTQVLAAQYDSITIVCDGSNWFIL